VGKTGPGKKQNLEMIQRGIMRKGDCALLYCTSSYKGHRQKVVGVGKIITITSIGLNQWHIKYDFRVFNREVPWNQMLLLVSPSDTKKLNNGKYMWILEVHPESFKKVVQAGNLSLNRA
jgi:hypothetical protein